MPEMKRRIIVEKPMDSAESKTTADISNNGRSKKQQRLLEYNLNKQIQDLYSKGKLIHTDIRYYVETLGIDIGNITVNVDNYMEVLMTCDKEARRRGFLF